jgi:hypothetical protein
MKQPVDLSPIMHFIHPFLLETDVGPRMVNNNTS